MLGLVNLLKDASRELWISLAGISIFLAILTSLFLFFDPVPTQDDWEIVDMALEKSIELEKPIANDFQLGYLLDSKGYTSQYYGFYVDKWWEMSDGNIIATHRE